MLGTILNTLKRHLSKPEEVVIPTFIDKETGSGRMSSFPTFMEAELEFSRRTLLCFLNFSGTGGDTFQKLDTFCQVYLLDFFQFLLEVGQGKNSAAPPKPAFAACVYERQQVRPEINRFLKSKSLRMRELMD